MAFKYKSFNVDKATEAQKVAALTANQQARGAGAVNIANRLAGNIQGLGQAAAAGGLFVDTSAAPGYQSPVTGQFTSMLMRNITSPINAEQKGILGLARLRNKKKYQAALKDNAARGYSGILTGTTPEPSSVSTQPIL